MQIVDKLKAKNNIWNFNFTIIYLILVKRTLLKNKKSLFFLFCFFKLVSSKNIRLKFVTYQQNEWSISSRARNIYSYDIIAKTNMVCKKKIKKYFFCNKVHYLLLKFNFFFIFYYFIQAC